MNPFHKLNKHKFIYIFLSLNDIYKLFNYSFDSFQNVLQFLFKFLLNDYFSQNNSKWCINEN